MKHSKSFMVFGPESHTGNMFTSSHLVERLMTYTRTHAWHQGNGLPQTNFWGGHGMYLKASISNQSLYN